MANPSDNSYQATCDLGERLVQVLAVAQLLTKKVKQQEFVAICMSTVTLLLSCCSMRLPEENQGAMVSAQVAAAQDKGVALPKCLLGSVAASKASNSSSHQATVLSCVFVLPLHLMANACRRP